MCDRLVSHVDDDENGDDDSQDRVSLVGQLRHLKHVKPRDLMTCHRHCVFVYIRTTQTSAQYTSGLCRLNHLTVAVCVNEDEDESQHRAAERHTLKAPVNLQSINTPH